MRNSLLLLLLAAICFACAAPQETASIRQNVAMLNERVQNLERRTDTVKSNQAETIGQTSSTADIYSRLDEMQMKLGSMNGRMEELDYKINRLEQQSRAATSLNPPKESAPTEDKPVITSITPSPTPLQVAPAAPQPSTPAQTQTPKVAEPAPKPVETAAPKPQEPAPKPTAPVAKPQATAPPAPVATPTGQPTVQVDAEKALYDKATQLQQEKKFASARKEYEAFAQKYPKSELADNALYSAGECYYVEKRYQDAIEVFQQVLDRYPKGNKVPNALLKQGTAFQDMGDRTAARILYERVVDKFPGTPQAKAAEAKLKELR